MANKDAQEVEVFGKTLICPICQATRFHAGRALLDGGGLSFFDLEWLGPGATIYTCDQCGHILWFKER